MLCPFFIVHIISGVNTHAVIVVILIFVNAAFFIINFFGLFFTFALFLIILFNLNRFSTEEHKTLHNIRELALHRGRNVGVYEFVETKNKLLYLKVFVNLANLLKDSFKDVFNSTRYSIKLSDSSLLIMVETSKEALCNHNLVFISSSFR